MIPASHRHRWIAGATIAIALAFLFPRSASAASCELRLSQADGGPLAGAVLSAVPLDGGNLPPPRPVTMDQKGRRFVPQILPVQVGGRVTFSNSDSVGHHVYSFSKARRFELYLPQGAPARSVEFDAPGVVALGCNVHDWMLAYIVVVETPYFAETDDQGRAVLGDLPAGRFRLEVWHPRITDAADHLVRPVELAKGSAESWHLVLTEPILPARDQVPGFGDYGGSP